MTKEVVHFSYSFCKSPNPSCVKVNLVLKPQSEDLVRWCEYESSEYQKEYFSESLPDLENYLNTLSMELDPKPKDLNFWNKALERIKSIFHLPEKVETLKYHTIFFTSDYPDPRKLGWTHVQPLLEKLEKFGAYRYFDYCEVNPVTLGCLQLLSTLSQSTEETYGKDFGISYSSVLIRTIKALDLHWD